MKGIFGGSNTPPDSERAAKDARMTETDRQEQRLREHQLQRIERLVKGLVATDGPDLNQKHVDMLWLVRELRARDAEIAGLRARWGNAKACFDRSRELMAETYPGGKHS